MERCNLEIGRLVFHAVFPCRSIFIDFRSDFSPEFISARA